VHKRTAADSESTYDCEALLPQPEGSGGLGVSEAANNHRFGTTDTVNVLVIQNRVILLHNLEVYFQAKLENARKADSQEARDAAHRSRDINRARARHAG
jgi:hypothetical protein